MKALRGGEDGIGDVVAAQEIALAEVARRPATLEIDERDRVIRVLSLELGPVLLRGGEFDRTGERVQDVLHFRRL